MGKYIVFMEKTDKYRNKTKYEKLSDAVIIAKRENKSWPTIGPALIFKLIKKVK